MPTMDKVVVACTERQPAESCDEAVLLILTDPLLGQRSSYQKCSICEGWFIVQNSEFIFTCTLTNVTDDSPAVEYELRTRYPTFICRNCNPGYCVDEHTLAEAQDDWPQHIVKQLSPDHAGAVYKLCSSDSTAILSLLQKTFFFRCPECGHESPEPLRTPREVQDYIQQHISSTSHPSAGPSSHRTLQDCLAQGDYSIPAVYGSEDMDSSPVEEEVISWMARLLVVVALHIIGRTRSNAPGSSRSSGQQLYSPWRPWAVEALTLDVQLIAAANCIRPSLAGLTRTPWHNLLDMILAPPYIAAAEDDAGMTAHKLAVLLKGKAKQLQQQQQGGPGDAPLVPLATAQDVCSLLGDMLATDACFKHFPAADRVRLFLAMASITAEEVAAALALHFVRDTHLKVCPCCAVARRKSHGCSYCIISLKCPHCRALAGDDADDEDYDDEQHKTAAAKLCPWCQGHCDAAVSSSEGWLVTRITAEQFDSLGIPGATAEQRAYFTDKFRCRNPWRISHWLLNGFIVMLVKSCRPSGKKSYDPYYIAPNGEKLRTQGEVNAWVQANPAAAVAAAAEVAAAVAAAGAAGTAASQPMTAGEAAGTSAAAAAAAGVGSQPGHAGSQFVEHVDLTASPRSDTTHENPGLTVDGDQQPHMMVCDQDVVSVPANSHRLKRSLSEQAVTPPQAAAAAGMATRSLNLGDDVNQYGAQQNTKRPRLAVQVATPLVPSSGAAAVSSAAAAAAAAGGVTSAAAAAFVDADAAAPTIDLAEPFGAAAVAADLEPDPAAGAAGIPSGPTACVGVMAAAQTTQLAEAPGASAAAAGPEPAPAATANMAAVSADSLGAAAALVVVRSAAVSAAEAPGKAVAAAAAAEREAESAPVKPAAKAFSAAVATLEASGDPAKGSGAAADALSASPAPAGPAAAQHVPAAAAAAASSCTAVDVMRQRDALVRSIDNVLFRTLMSVRSLRFGHTTNTLYNARLQLKQLSATDPAEALLGLTVMHQFVSCLEAANLSTDVFLLPNVQQLLDECWLQAVPDPCLPGAGLQQLMAQPWLRVVPKQYDSGATPDKATVLELLLLCWTHEHQRTQCGSSDDAAPAAAAAIATTGLCPATLQVMLQAWKGVAVAVPAEAAPAVAGISDQVVKSLSQLILRLVEGLAKVLLSWPGTPANGESATGQLAGVDDVTTQQQSLQWQYAMELCLDRKHSGRDIAAEVDKVLKDWQV